MKFESLDYINLEISDKVYWPHHWATDPETPENFQDFIKLSNSFHQIDFTINAMYDLCDNL